MDPDHDFRKIIFEGHALVSVNILYFLPDQRHILNEFHWQTLDICPRFPRMRRFIDYWHKEIEGKIKEVTITHVPHIPNPTWTNGIILTLDGPLR